MFINTILKTARNHGVSAVFPLLKYYFLKIKASFWGPGRECPICGWTGPEFIPLLVPSHGVVRAKVQCPSCGSYERHRAYYFFYKKFLSAPENSHLKKMIHFAPETCFEVLFRSFASEYVKSNYDNPSLGELSLDLRNLTLEDESYDLFVMNYVLSCMLEDRKAIKSMWRVLCNNGVVLAGDGVGLGQKTVELESPGYGGMHRSYGMLDLAERFAPFAVNVINVNEDLTLEQRERFGLNSPEYMLILTKRNGNLTEGKSA